MDGQCVTSQHHTQGIEIKRQQFLLTLCIGIQYNISRLLALAEFNATLKTHSAWSESVWENTTSEVVARMTLSQRKWRGDISRFVILRHVVLCSVARSQLPQLSRSQRRSSTFGRLVRPSPHALSSLRLCEQLPSKAVDIYLQ